MTSTPTRLPECLSGATLMSLAKGALVFQPGDHCANFVYLLSGVIRVDLIAKSGKAATLYRFGANESCVLTTSCLLSGEDYGAEARVEADAEACMLPRRLFDERLNSSAAFRELVFASFASRLAALMAKIEAIAFTPIDIRLAARVLELTVQNPVAQITHDQLAADLGTAREVISRKLAQWDRQGWIERGRGGFTVIDVVGLRTLAASK